MIVLTASAHLITLAIPPQKNAIRLVMMARLMVSAPQISQSIAALVVGYTTV
jgi:hypothetical protein